MISGEDFAAENTITKFISAVNDGEGEDACDLISPRFKREIQRSSGTSCEEAIQQLPQSSGLPGPDGFESIAVEDSYELAGRTAFETNTPIDYVIVDGKIDALITPEQ